MILFGDKLVARQITLNQETVVEWKKNISSLIAERPALNHKSSQILQTIFLDYKTCNK